MTINIIVNGAKGRMGTVLVDSLSNQKELTLVAVAGRTDNLSEIIKQHQADVVVDLTNPQAVYDNTLTILESGARPVVGTSGLTIEQVYELQKIANQRQSGGVIAPNFSISAVLMMKYARDAAAYFNEVEIIEHHHDKKLDAPSGTAIKTAQLIAESRQQRPKSRDETELFPGARGANYEDIHIHAVRLPGRMAHQEVIFGGSGEILTLRTDTIDRNCYMPGIHLACKKAMELKSLVYGLEHIL